MRAALICVLASCALPAGAPAAPFGEPLPVPGTGLATVALAAAGDTVVYGRGSALYAWNGGVPQFLGWGEQEERRAFPFTVPALDEGTDGTRVIAWAENLGEGSARMAIAPPGERFAATRSWRRPAAAGAIDAVVAGPGAAVVAWTTPAAIEVARAAGGRWLGRPVALPASAGATGLDLSAGADGQVALLWVAPDGVRLALRPPGAAAFGPAQAVPGEAGDLPVVFALPDGGVLATTTISDVARRAPDGTWGAVQHVAGDVALAVLAARAGAPAPVTVAHLDLGPVAADRTAFAWADGTRAALQEWGHFDNDNAFLIFGGGPPRTHGDRISAPGPTVVGGGEHGVPVAGARPGAITVYAAHAGRLYALERPAAPDRHGPGIDAQGPSTFRGSSPDRTVWMFASFTEAATAHVRAFVRQGSRWRRVAVRVLHGPQRIATGAPFEPVVLEVPLPVARGGCALARRWRMRVRITARDGAGHVGRRTVLRTVACHED